MIRTKSSGTVVAAATAIAIANWRESGILSFRAPYTRPTNSEPTA